MWAALPLLLGAIVYASWYWYGEFNNLAAEIDFMDKTADWIEHAKRGQYVPAWLPAELVMTQNGYGELRLRDTRGREPFFGGHARQAPHRFWFFIVINRQGKIYGLAESRIMHFGDPPK